jgi:hypothetical protein
MLMGRRRRNLFANVDGFRGVGDETSLVLLGRVRAGRAVSVYGAASVWITDLIVWVVSTHSSTNLKHTLGLRIRDPFPFII